MLTIEEIKQKKKEYGYTNAQLAEVSGVPFGTVQKVMGNVTKSPGYDTLKALSAVFEKTQTAGFHYEFGESSPDVLKEAQPAYNINPFPFTEYNVNYYDRQGTYTLEDYLALPDEQRVELIDGVIYDMGAPNVPHQSIGGFIYAELLNYVRRNKGKCMPYIAPTDVQLDRDNRTIVQPDVMIVCDRSKINRKRIFGAPDFVVEVLSPSTKKKDFYLKGEKYMNAGVREYWLVDPDNETVMVFSYKENDLELKLYNFEDKVPVGIYNGECVIDFKEIKEQYAFIGDL